MLAMKHEWRPSSECYKIEWLETKEKHIWQHVKLYAVCTQIKIEEQKRCIVIGDTSDCEQSVNTLY